MSGLCDVGKTIRVYNDWTREFIHNAEVVMVIEAPRGRMTIYDRPEKAPQVRSQDQTLQGEAIKAFMEFNNGG